MEISYRHLDPSWRFNHLVHLSVTIIIHLLSSLPTDADFFSIYVHDNMEHDNILFCP
jgi:hypothetical protein